MKHLTLFTLLLLSSACALQACHNSEKKENSSTLAADSSLDTVSKPAQSLGGKLTGDEIAFIQKAATGGMMEIEVGNTALQQSKNPEVKKFAQMMVTDHTKIGNELNALAKSKGLGLPATFPAAEQKHLDAMKTLSGDAFDKHYVSMMVTDHNKTVDLFSTAKMYHDTDIRNFATKTLPVIEAHYEAASKLDSIMQKKKTNNGDDLLDISTGTQKRNR